MADRRRTAASAGRSGAGAALGLRLRTRSPEGPRAGMDQTTAIRSRDQRGAAGRGAGRRGRCQARRAGPGTGPIVWPDDPIASAERAHPWRSGDGSVVEDPGVPGCGRVGISLSSCWSINVASAPEIETIKGPDQVEVRSAPLPEASSLVPKSVAGSNPPDHPGGSQPWAAAVRPRGRQGDGVRVDLDGRLVHPRRPVRRSSSGSTGSSGWCQEDVDLAAWLERWFVRSFLEVQGQPWHEPGGRARSGPGVDEPGRRTQRQGGRHPDRDGRRPRPPSCSPPTASSLPRATTASAW